MEISEISREIIGAAIEVHRVLGPGLLESSYEMCLCRELAMRGIPFESQQHLPVAYKGLLLDCGYRIDILVADSIVVEIKSVEGLIPIHEAQLLTYLRLGGWKLGLLLNFNERVLVDGVKRLANKL